MFRIQIRVDPHYARPGSGSRRERKTAVKPVPVHEVKLKLEELLKVRVPKSISAVCLFLEVCHNIVKDLLEICFKQVLLLFYPLDPDPNEALCGLGSDCALKCTIC